MAHKISKSKAETAQNKIVNELTLVEGFRDQLSEILEGLEQEVMHIRNCNDRILGAQDSAAGDTSERPSLPGLVGEIHDHIHMIKTGICLLTEERERLQRIA